MKGRELQKPATLPAHTMFLAFLVGMSTGFFLAPIALVPVSALFLAMTAAYWVLNGGLSMEKLVIGLLYLVILNIGYLLGALVRRWWSAPR